MKKLIVLLVILGVTGPVLANEFDLPPGKWWEDQRVVDRVGITGEQQSEIREVVYERARKMIDLKADVEKAGLDLAAAVDRAEFDASAVRSAYAGVSGRPPQTRERALRNAARGAADAQHRPVAEDAGDQAEGAADARPAAPSRPTAAGREDAAGGLFQVGLRIKGPGLTDQKNSVVAPAFCTCFP